MYPPIVGEMVTDPGVTCANEVEKASNINVITKSTTFFFIISSFKFLLKKHKSILSAKLLI